MGDRSVSLIGNKGDGERERLRFGRKDWGGFLPGSLKIAQIGGRLTSPWRLKADKGGKREDDGRKRVKWEKQFEGYLQDKSR